MLIKETMLLTNNIKATAEFYTKVLQLPLIDKSENRVSFSVGHTTLSFLNTSQSNPVYHFAFSIPSNKVDEAHEYIAARTMILPFTGETTIADFTNWNAHAFYFHDNQNNILEFIAHHDLPNDTDKPFSPASIIGICEIGIPVDNVAQAGEKIFEDYKVPYYIKGPRLSDFSVMGDEYGLLIVTKIGRGWLPTQQPAERYFTKIIFKNNGQDKSITVS